MASEAEGLVRIVPEMLPSCRHWLVAWSFVTDVTVVVTEGMESLGKSSKIWREFVRDRMLACDATA